MKKRMTRKATMRRDEILKAALACFREKGLKATSIDDICTRLSISPGHLYYYFKSKEQLIEEIVLLSQKFVMDAADALIERDDALDILLNIDLSAQGDTPPPFTLDNPTLLELYVEAARNPRLAKLLRTYWTVTLAKARAILDSARKKGRIRSEADQERLLTILTMFTVARPLAEIADPDYDPMSYAATIRHHVSPLIARTAPKNPGGPRARRTAGETHVGHQPARRPRRKP